MWHTAILAVVVAYHTGRMAMATLLADRALAVQRSHFEHALLTSPC